MEHKFEVTIQSEDGPEETPVMANILRGILIARLNVLQLVSVKPIQKTHTWYTIEWERDSHQYSDQFESLEALRMFRQNYPDVIVRKVIEVTKLYRELNPTGV